LIDVNDEPEERPRFLRQYALTGGRARSHGEDLPFDALVRTVPGTELTAANTPEHFEICRLCASPIAVAEVAARMQFHLGIARVLVSDLAAGGFVEIARAKHDERGPDLFTLERLLDDLQAL
jgi:Protein of unknown function (DUF742)